MTDYRDSPGFRARLRERLHPVALAVAEAVIRQFDGQYPGRFVGMDVAFGDSPSAAERKAGVQENACARFAPDERSVKIYVLNIWDDSKADAGTFREMVGLAVSDALRTLVDEEPA